MRKRRKKGGGGKKKKKKKKKKRGGGGKKRKKKRRKKKKTNVCTGYIKRVLFRKQNKKPQLGGFNDRVRSHVHQKHG